MSESEPQTTSITAHDVAAELRRRLPGIGVTKLHKLLYYAQGWHLAWIGEPMFDDRIEAWVNGPVVADLWKAEKRGRPLPESRPVTGSIVATLDDVVERYGHSTGRDLIGLTHGEDPWRDLSEGDDASVGPSPENTHEALRKWFESDDELVARNAKVERLRRSPLSDPFADLSGMPEIAAQVDAAVARAVAGHVIRETRPG